MTTTAEALALYEQRLQELNAHRNAHADVISEHTKLKARLNDAAKQVEKAAKAEVDRRTEGATTMASGSMMRVKADVIPKRAPDTGKLLKAWPDAFKEAPDIFSTTIAKLEGLAKAGELPLLVSIDDVCSLSVSVKITIEPNT